MGRFANVWGVFGHVWDVFGDVWGVFGMSKVFLAMSDVFFAMFWCVFGIFGQVLLNLCGQPYRSTTLYSALHCRIPPCRSSESHQIVDLFMPYPVEVVARLSSGKNMDLFAKCSRLFTENIGLRYG